jgi:hypothetical protein
VKHAIFLGVRGSSADESLMEWESIMSKLRASGRAAALALPLLLTGCIEKVSEGGLTIFKFETWGPMLVMVVSIGLIIAAVWIFKRVKWAAALLMVLGLAGAVILGPGLFGDFVKVDAEHFELKTGFWFSPTHHEVRFDGLASIDLIAETRRSGRGKSTTFYLLCKPRSGAAQKVPIGDLMTPARDLILANAQARGVPINDLRGGQQ